MPAAGPDQPADTPPRPARRPALAVFVSLSAGLILARHTPEVPAPIWFAASAALLAAALFLRAWPCRAAMLLATLLIGAGVLAARVNERPADSLLNLINPDPLAEPATVRLTGLVLDTPRLETPLRADPFHPPAPRSTTFSLHLFSADTDRGPITASGTVRVRLDGPPPALAAGRFVRLTGRFRPVAGPRNPGEPPRDLLAAQRGVVGTLIVPTADLIQPSDPPASLTARLRAAAARTLAALHDHAERTLGPEQPASTSRALVRAMLLGERDPALAEVESAFRRVGLVHLVAISGFNMAVLAGVVLLGIRLTGDRGWLEPVAAALAVALYMLILPGEASIQRSGLTLLVFSAAEAAGRRYDRLNLLALVACTMLLARPMDLWSLGFQLSFGIVAALLWLHPRVHERLWGPTIRGLIPTPRQRTWWWRAGASLAGALKAQLSASLLAWAVAAPLIAHHTGTISPLVPVASLVVLPATVILMVAGYAAMVIGLVLPGAADLSSSILSLLGDATVWIVTRLDEWPGATLYLPRLGPAWTLTATIAAIDWLGWARPLRDARAWAAAAITLTWSAIALTAGPAPRDGALLRLDALSVGDGSCTLVRTRSATMLVNAGAPGVDADSLRKSLRELGAWRTPTVLLTDDHLGHWSELPGLLKPLAVRTVLIPASIAAAADLDSSSAAAALLRALEQHRITVRILAPGDRFALGEAEARIAGSPEGSGPALAVRLRVRTPTGPRSALLAPASAYARLAEWPPDDRRADIALLPQVTRAADRPAEFLRASGAAAVIHAGSATHARALLARLGDERGRVRTTVATAAGAEIARDGSVTTPVRDAE